MVGDLRNRVVIVTGASRGIGRAVAEVLVSRGARVLAVSRTEPHLRELELAHPGHVVACPTDLRDREAGAQVVGAAVSAFGRVDAVVNVAGATVRGDFLELPDDVWEDGFALKFFGAMRLTRAAWPHLVERNGAVVFTAGIGGRTGSAEFAIGGAVNAAVMNLTKVLADRGLDEGVRVNAVNPGSVRTERLDRRIVAHAEKHGLSLDAAAEALARELGVARFGEPREIANAIAFLLSDEASYCHGVVLDVDGGATHTL